MAFDENLDQFFAVTDFAVPALWKGTTDVVGIFDNAYFEDPVGTGAANETSTPIFRTKSSAVAGAAHGDAFRVNETDYKIVGVQPDGTGTTVLVLQAQ